MMQKSHQAYNSGRSTWTAAAGRTLKDSWDSRPGVPAATSCRLPVDSRGPPMLVPLPKRGVDAVDAGEKVLQPSLSS